MLAIETLDKRLLAISKKVRKGSRLADVGCDHGLLITALRQDEIILGGVACDINEMPLKKAVDRVLDMGFNDCISCRLGDGLEKVLENEVDDVVIAGMGGELISDILSQCSWSKNPKKQFILQPMTKISVLRDWLLENGYKIHSEDGCSVSNKYYTVMTVSFVGECKKLHKYDSYLYVGELAENPNSHSKMVVKNSITALENKALGVKRVDPNEAEEIFDLIKQLSQLIEKW